MKTIHCEARVFPDGHLLLPPEVVKKLNIKPSTSIKRRVIIFNTSKKRRGNGLNRFCGRWQDERDADDIVREVMGNRSENLRSEKIKW